MIRWADLPGEEKALLNPAFIGVLVGDCARGYERESGQPMPFALAFVVVPFVLHRATRESLPRLVTTSMIVWLQNHPASRVGLAERARSLAPYVRVGILYGHEHQGVRIGDAAGLTSAVNQRTRRGRQEASGDTAACRARAEFVGRWWGRVNSPDTIMALLGVQP